MPSNVVHCYFAQKVLESLPQDAKAVASKDMQAYLVGAQGPDLMFYMRLEKPPLNRLGEMQHDSFDTAEIFRKSAAYAAGELSGTVSAFLLGQLCHYALDSELHSYINHREKDLPAYYPKSAAPRIHIVYESALDYLCVKDFIKAKPAFYKGYKNLNLSKTSRFAIAKYYSEVVAPHFGMTLPPETAAKSLRLMRLFVRICDDMTGVKYLTMRCVEALFRFPMSISAFIRPRKERPDEDWLNHKRMAFPKYKNLPETVNFTVEELTAAAHAKALSLIADYMGTLAGNNEPDQRLYLKNYTGAVPSDKV